MTILCLYLAATPVSTIAFERISTAHALLSTGSFVATSKITGLAQNVSTKYEMKYRWPAELRLRTLHPRTGELIRDRVIEPTRIVDYDPYLAQYMVTKRSSNEALGKTLATLDKDLDDLFLAYTASEGFEVWAADMIKLSPWTISGDSRKFVLSYKKGDKKIVLEAGKSNSLVRRVDIATGPQRLVWDIVYGSSVSGLAFKSPSGVYEVPIFDQKMLPPTYKDASARRVAIRVFDAYSGLRSLGFDVVRESGTTKVQMIDDFVRQDDSNASWTYDGKTFTLFNKRTGRWYEGNLGFSDVVDAVGDLGTRVDPTVRLLMSRFNPYRKRLGDGATVKVVGTMPLDGKEVTILESESENALITLFVREDGLVASSSTRAKRSTGDPDETVDLKYDYFKVPRDAAARFRLKVPLDKSAVKLKPASAS